MLKLLQEEWLKHCLHKSPGGIKTWARDVKNKEVMLSPNQYTRKKGPRG